MTKTARRYAAALAAALSFGLLSAVPAHAEGCQLNPALNGPTQLGVTSFGVNWQVNATGCTGTPAVSLELRDAADPSSQEGIVDDNLATSGSQIYTGLLPGHTYDVTLSANVDIHSESVTRSYTTLTGVANVFTIHVPKKAKYNKSIRITGRLMENSVNPLAGQSYSIRFDPTCTSHFRTIASGYTGVHGQISETVKARSNGCYFALSHQYPSSVAKIKVTYAIKYLHRIHKGHKQTMILAVAPKAHPHAALFRRVHHKWKFVTATRVRNGKVKFVAHHFKHGGYRAVIARSKHNVRTALFIRYYKH